MKQVRSYSLLAALAQAALAVLPAHASSHREAPLITSMPKLDCSDFYLFNSYEAGRDGYVTLIADYLPLQDAYGGPNYFSLDPTGVYEIHIDNSGDAREDITFQFQFTNTYKDIALTIGDGADQKSVAIPLVNVGGITAADTSNLNLVETYTLKIIRGDRRTGTAQFITNSVTGSTVFEKPVDFIGTKSLPDYETYAKAHIYSITIPGADSPGRVFVGQRKDPFVVNLGETFDLVNLNPLGPVDGGKDTLADKNVTALVLEVPKSLLLAGTNQTIAAWTTASKVSGTADAPVYTQVSRLGHPLVNEVVIGLKDKDKFNASEPKDDAQFLDYVTHPTLPALLNVLFGVTAPKTPRTNDLVPVFLTGVPGLNKTDGVGEMLRLNTAIPAVPAAQQKTLGVLAGDNAGFPNGRRPGDDVVDAALRVMMGVLLSDADAPSGKLPYTDGAPIDASFFDVQFPYLRTPLQGAPNTTIEIEPQTAPTVTGPFRPVTGTYTPATGILSVPKPAADAGFLRIKSDSKITVDQVAVQGNQLTTRVK